MSYKHWWPLANEIALCHTDFIIHLFEANLTPSGKKTVYILYLHTQEAQSIQVFIMKSLTAVGKHCGYMLITSLRKSYVYTLNLCGLYFLP